MTKKPIKKSSTGMITCQQAIEQIRAALKRRSKKRWSVRTYSGTGYGWIHISSPPSRHKPGGSYMTQEDIDELSRLFNLPAIKCGPQFISVSDTDAHYQEYIDRAEGREPIVLGTEDEF